MVNQRIRIILEGRGGRVDVYIVKYVYTNRLSVQWQGLKQRSIRVGTSDNKIRNIRYSKVDAGE